VLNLEKAKSLLRSSGCACAVVSAGGEQLSLSGRGISPIISLLKNDPSVLRGAAAADRVIGKAAAMLLAYGGAAAVWGDIMSKPALDFLNASDIPASCGRVVPILKNREGTGQCPMEMKAASLTSASEAYEAFAVN
jgi:hypothetical protein